MRGWKANDASIRKADVRTIEFRRDLLHSGWTDSIAIDKDRLWNLGCVCTHCAARLKVTRRKVSGLCWWNNTEDTRRAKGDVRPRHVDHARVARSATRSLGSAIEVGEYSDAACGEDFGNGTAHGASCDDGNRGRSH